MSPDNRRLSISEEWAVVERSLATAHHNLNGAFTAAAVTHSYYACFHAAQALLLAEDCEPVTHAGVRSELARRFVATGRIPRQVARSLATLQQEREDADYSRLPPPDAEAARQSLTEAEHFCSVARAWLEDAGWL